MPPAEDSLLQATRSHFDAVEDVRIEPIAKGGSDRKFYRVGLTRRRASGGGAMSLILVAYTAQKEENRHYVRIAQFLETIGVRAPKIFFHDEAAGLIWVEDLGARDLWTFRPPAAGGHAAWPARRAYYQSALEEIWRLHTRGWEGLARFKFTLQIEFNAALYRWEQGYFFDHCLGRVFAGRVDPAAVARVAAEPVWGRIAERLAAWPRVLVHRDFQSQNVILHGEHAHLIDFQGMRPGLAHYDLASLLHDPYARLPAEERGALLDYYLALGVRKDLGPNRARFDEIYALCAVQRLMQALGAYGFLGLVKEKPEFLPHVPVALGSLREVAATVPGLEAFSELLAALPTA